MANLVPSVIGLDKGLNLQTAKLVAPAGSVLDTLNYEQVDFQGQKRIDGFVRYDGSVLPAIDEYYVITLATDFNGGVGALIGAISDEDGSDKGLYGVVVDVSGGTTVTAVVINENATPAQFDALYYFADGVATGSMIVNSIASGTATALTADAHYNNLLAYTEVLRSRVGELPGPVAGLHWFRDRLYAVAGVLAASIDGATPVIYPNDILLVGNAQYRQVLDAYTLDNTRIVFLGDALDGSLTTSDSDWANVGSEVDRVAVAGGSGVQVGEIANGYEDLTTEIASFFESRTEAQVLEEDGPSGPYDYGWRFKHLGWEVLFENGISLYGSLPSLNQNIVGLGVQGPTPITGNNGKPLLLVQKVSVVGKPTQVNGWKNSDSTTSYDLDAGHVAEDDSLYVYADAYVSWTAGSSTLQAPGMTSATLTEYPANNTVVVEIP